MIQICPPPHDTTGLSGALEYETAASYWGLTRAVQSYWRDSTYTTTALVKPWLPYLMGLAFPLPWAVFNISGAPHGRDGNSQFFGRRFRAALGDATFFHGSDAPGPLDLSLYGTLKCFTRLGSPPTAAVLDKCELRAWYERMEKAVDARRPIVLWEPAAAK